MIGTVRRALPLLIPLGLVALAVCLGVQKIRSFDYWWHLRTGALIVANGAVPTHDPYTYTVPGARWIDIHWLFQLALYGLYWIGGHTAVIASKVASACGLVWMLGRIGWRRDAAWVSGLALGLLLLVAGDRLMPRPELPSFLLLAGVLALLYRHDVHGGRSVFWIVALQLVWVNVHGLFALGLAVCGIALAGELLRPVVMPGEGLRTTFVARLAAVTLLSGAVSLVNPNGLAAVLYPLDQFAMIGSAETRGLFGSLIAELIPPLGPQGSLHGLALVLVCALALLSSVSMATNWRRVSAFDPLIWVAFLYLALGAQRNVALFALVAAPIAVRNAGAFLARHPLPGGVTAAANVLVGLLLLATAVDVARDRFFERSATQREAGLGIFDFYYPIAAAEWIDRERPPGPIYHHMADGGYLIWRLWPDYPVMVDGRLEVFGPETFARLQVAGPADFRRLDAEYHFGLALIHFGLIESRELLWWLHLNPNWKLVQVDATAALFVRDSGSTPWPALDPDDPALFPPGSPEPSPSDRLRRLSQVHFYSSLRRFETALALWEETLQRYPALPQGPVIHAYLLQRNGFAAAAETLLRRELEARPSDAKLLAQVADLRHEAGDPESARELYGRALALEPRHAHALYKLGTLAEQEQDLESARFYYLRAMEAAGHPADPVAVAAAHRLVALGFGPL